jgi:hypothetical protein
LRLAVTRLLSVARLSRLAVARLAVTRLLPVAGLPVRRRGLLVFLFACANDECGDDCGDNEQSSLFSHEILLGPKRAIN